jgi:hypothetical protein
METLIAALLVPVLLVIVARVAVGASRNLLLFRWVLRRWEWRKLISSRSGANPNQVESPSIVESIHLIFTVTRVAWGVFGVLRLRDQQERAKAGISDWTWKPYDPERLADFTMRR